MSDDPAPAPTAAPRKRITTERRERPFRAGIASCIAGLVVVVLGGGIAYGQQVAQVVAADDRAEIPDELTFVAEDRTYAVVLLRELPGFQSIERLRPITNCLVTLADGSTVEVRGSRPNGSIETDLGATLGRFDAPAGPTTVACSFDESGTRSGYFVAVGPERSSVRVVSYVLMGVGLAMIAAGIALIVIGIRGRQVVTVTPAPPAMP